MAHPYLWIVSVVFLVQAARATTILRGHPEQLMKHRQITEPLASAFLIA